MATKIINIKLLSVKSVSLINTFVQGATRQRSAVSKIKMWPLQIFKNCMKNNGLFLHFVRRCNVGVNHWLLENAAFQRFQKKCVDEHQQNLKKVEELEDSSQHKSDLLFKNSENKRMYELLNNISSQKQLMSQLRELMKDDELKEIAKEDLKVAEDQLTYLLENQLASLLVPVSDNIKEIQFEVSAGVGGAEAMLFTKELFDMYYNYSVYKGWKCYVQEYQESETNGLRNGSLSIEGDYVYNTMKFESGVHRVQRIPQTERTGRIHTSTSTVVILPQPSQIAIEILDKDVKVETKRASGAGGQHVNKTESAIRMTHIPTGLVTECQTSRSQIQNRADAKRKLQLMIYQGKFEEQIQKQQSSRKIQVGTSGRSEKIRTYNYLQDRVTDHRINVSLHHLKEFILGGAELDSLIQQLINESQKEIILESINKLL